MIRALRPEDLDQVMQIWLDANLEAHCFLPESYWCDHMEEVRAALPAAQVFVYQDWEGLQGFAGLTGDYLGGALRPACRPVQGDRAGAAGAGQGGAGEPDTPRVPGEQPGGPLLPAGGLCHPGRGAGGEHRPGRVPYGVAQGRTAPSTAARGALIR